MMTVSGKYDCLFWSCDHVVVAKSIPTTRDGVPYKILIMFPTEKLMSRYPELVNKDILDYSIMTEGVGVFYREYPSEYIIELFDNPDSPWLIGLCNFDGSVVLDNKLKVMADRLKTMQSVLNAERGENSMLREELKESKSRIAELKED
jgi:hypothetical protein